MKRQFARVVRFHAPIRGVTYTFNDRPQEQLPESPPVETVEEPEVPDPVDPQRQETLLSLLETLHGRLDRLADARAHELAELRELAVELAVAVASHIVKEKLDRNELRFDQLVREAITHMGFEDGLRVRMHPLDCVDLQELHHSWDACLKHIELEPDDRLSRGSCVVLGREGGLLSSLEEQLENVRETLLQGIDYARVEQREIIGSVSPMRRVQDRGKLA